MTRIAVLLLVLGVLFKASAFDGPSLHSHNFDTETSGKNVFIAFFAPWCAYCKRLAPDWEKLAEELDGHDVVLVADVDCTSTHGKKLCEYFEIESFPTIMYGDPHNMEEYNGERSYDGMSKFCKESLIQSICSVKHLDLCDDETKAKIESYLAMSKEELMELVKTEKVKLTDAKTKYEEEVDALQEKYEEAAQTRDEAVAAVRDGGIGLMKAVVEAKKADEKGDDSKDEL